MDQKSGYFPADTLNRHHRRSIRLRGYNYEQNGAYFITACTQDRICLFGDIVDDTMVLNDAGIMVEKWWNKIPRRYDAVEIDAFVIMPNHVHGIIIISKNDDRVGGGLSTAPSHTTGHTVFRIRRLSSATLYRRKVLRNQKSKLE